MDFALTQLDQTSSRKLLPSPFQLSDLKPSIKHNFWCGTTVLRLIDHQIKSTLLESDGGRCIKVIRDNLVSEPGWIGQPVVELPVTNQ